MPNYVNVDTIGYYTRFVLDRYTVALEMILKLRGESYQQDIYPTEGGASDYCHPNQGRFDSHLLSNEKGSLSNRGKLFSIR